MRIFGWRALSEKKLNKLLRLLSLTSEEHKAEDEKMSEIFLKGTKFDLNKEDITAGELASYLQLLKGEYERPVEWMMLVADHDPEKTAYRLEHAKYHLGRRHGGLMFTIWFKFSYVLSRKNQKTGKFEDHTRVEQEREIKTIQMYKDMVGERKELIDFL